MLKSYRKYLPIVTALTAVFAAGVACDRADQVAGPAPEAAIEEAYHGFETPSFQQTASLENGFTIVKGDAGDTEVRQVIDQNGGVLYLGRHLLVIPKNAVSAPTEFVMAPVKDGSIHVDLTATSSGGTLNDVGSAGFAKPLWLFLSYAGADGVPADESKMAIAWLKVNGEVAAMPSYVDPNKDFVIGLLKHFSGYIIVAN